MKFVEFHLSDRPILVNLELLESVGIDKDGKTQLAFTDLNDYFSIDESYEDVKRKILEKA